MRTKPMALIGAALLALGAAPALAGIYVCRGSLGAVTVDNLRVPDGARCRLQGTRVQGTVKVERDATLTASRINVVGNVQAENARHVHVARSAIGGSVQVKQGGGAASCRRASMAISSSIRTGRRWPRAATGSVAAFR